MAVPQGPNAVPAVAPGTAPPSAPVATFPQFTFFSVLRKFSASTAVIDESASSAYTRNSSLETS